jgi:TusE/DsrC/DsvC family sulfur relay protein
LHESRNHAPEAANLPTLAPSRLDCPGWRTDAQSRHLQRGAAAMTLRPLQPDAPIKVSLDEEGYLLDPADWDEELAWALAAREGIALSELHWQVLRFMRRFLDEHQVAPDARFVIRFLADEAGLGGDARRSLFELFPYGYVKQACRIAGMRRPRAWSTG